MLGLGGGIARKFDSKLIVKPFKAIFTDCLKKFRIKKKILLIVGINIRSLLFLFQFLFFLPRIFGGGGAGAWLNVYYILLSYLLQQWAYYIILSTVSAEVQKALSATGKAIPHKN